MKLRAAVLLLVLLSPPALAQWRVSSSQTVGGFVFPESVAYDPRGKVLYVGNFGGQKLAPAEKDGLGYISKVGLNGKVLEQKWVPAAGGEPLHKPKGIWIRGERRLLFRVRTDRPLLDAFAFVDDSGFPLLAPDPSLLADSAGLAASIRREVAQLGGDEGTPSRANAR